MLKDAVDRIQGNLGGNVVTITVDGKPVAMAFMDTDDVNTANMSSTTRESHSASTD